VPPAGAAPTPRRANADMAHDPLLPQAFHWMGLALRTPADWEIVRHGLGMRKGQLVFVDRRRQRLQLSWEVVDQRPPLGKVIDDFKSKAREEDPDAKIDPMTPHHGWVGLHRRKPDGAESGTLTRAVRHDARTDRLLEAILMHAADRDAEGPLLPEAGDLSDHLLAALAVESEGHRATRWRAFGLDITVPTGFRVTATEIKPGDSSVLFRGFDPDGPPAQWEPNTNDTEVRVRRRAMANAWFNGNLEALLKLQLRGVGDIDTASETCDGRETLTATSREPGRPLQKVGGRLRDRRDVLWLDEAANAVMQVTTLSRKRDPVDPRDIKAAAVPPGQ